MIYHCRPGGFDESKQRVAQDTTARTLADVVQGADVFLGCSTAGVLTSDMVKTMARAPIILALAKADISEEVATAYAGKELTFGTDSLIPPPVDDRAPGGEHDGAGGSGSGEHGLTLAMIVRGALCRLLR